MSVERIRVLVGIVAGLLGIVVSLLAITDNWDKVEAALDAIYPLPLLVLAVSGAVVMTVLYVRERRRKRPTTYREASNEDRERRDQKKAEARRTVTLIMNEVASNRRLMEAASSQDPPSRFTQRENWMAHRHALAELQDAERAYALTMEAYDAFDTIDDLNRYPSSRNPTNNELRLATVKAQGAEAELKHFLDFLEGPRTRFVASA